ncbi:hypothetical protein ACFL2V_01135 [Pseudomonadota bacterium]
MDMIRHQNIRMYCTVVSLSGLSRSSEKLERQLKAGKEIRILFLANLVIKDESITTRTSNPDPTVSVSCHHRTQHSCHNHYAF